MRYDTFIGQLDDDGYTIEIPYVVCSFDNYPDARKWMIERLVPFLSDECESCRDDGRRALVDLVIAPEPRHGGVWLASIEGSDYRILAIENDPL